MRIYLGEALNGDSPIMSMVVVAEDEASARQVMHEFEAEVAMDDPRLDYEIWLSPELARVQLLGDAAPGWLARSVVSTVPGPA